MKEQCEKIRNMILEGTESAEVAEHMKGCDECRMLSESVTFFKEVRVPMENTEKTVPAGINDFIKAAARQNLKKKETARKSRILRFSFEIGSLAALFVFAMTILYQQPQDMPAGTTPQQASVSGSEIISASIEKELDNIHSALADISDNLNDCGVTEDFSLTDLSELSQLELDYALYQANL